MFTSAKKNNLVEDVKNKVWRISATVSCFSSSWCSLFQKDHKYQVVLGPGQASKNTGNKQGIRQWKEWLRSYQESHPAKNFANTKTEQQQFKIYSNFREKNLRGLLMKSLFCASLTIGLEKKVSITWQPML